jgi:Fe2+ transport system protein FeoA
VKIMGWQRVCLFALPRQSTELLAGIFVGLPDADLDNDNCLVYLMQSFFGKPKNKLSALHAGQLHRILSWNTQRKVLDGSDRSSPLFAAHMTRDQSAALSHFLRDIRRLCRRNKQCGEQAHQAATPLSESCCSSRMRVCAVTGDRQICARMATLGILPGSELELLCKGDGQHCMIKINGATISLDALAASAILVAPV